MIGQEISCLKIVSEVAMTDSQSLLHAGETRVMHDQDILFGERQVPAVMADVRRVSHCRTLLGFVGSISKQEGI